MRLGAIGTARGTQKLLAHSARVVVNDITPESEAQEWMQAASWPPDRCVYIMPT